MEASRTRPAQLAHALEDRVVFSRGKMPDYCNANSIKALANKIIHAQNVLADTRELLKLLELEVRNALCGAVCMGRFYPVSPIDKVTPLPALRSPKCSLVIISRSLNVPWIPFSPSRYLGREQYRALALIR